ncbi:MAG: hypothetical protein OXU45_02270, partial [Candidatus Melainabacteria bacterium]|nr:hypothetical protein [Candidatus Melainabacteria bacterium]
MQDSRINRDANAAKSRNWRERNDRVQRFLSSLDNQSTINHRRRAGAGRINDINPRTSFSGRASANTNLRSTGSRSSSSNNESSSSVRNRRIGTTGFSSNKQTNAKRLTTADFLRMQVDGDHNGSISLEEILLYVIDRKSKNQQIPQAMYSVHRKFADVVESLELIDNDESLDIEDGEAARAIISRRANQLGNSLDMEVVDFVLNYLNDNIDGIDAAAQTIDTNPDGAVSNIEVLTALLAERRGELDTSDPNIDAVLRTNDSYDQLVALVASMSGDFDGVVSDEQAFDIILALRASNPGDTLLQQALFLGTNDNLAEIEASVAVFDSLADGQISNEEFITVIKEMRAGNLSEEDHQIAMNILRAREPYASILNLIEAIDTEVDGSISDDEVIDFTLASLRGEFDLDTSLV